MAPPEEDPVRTAGSATEASASAQEDVVAGVRRVVATALGAEAADSLEAGEFAGEAWLRLPREAVPEVFRALRDDPELSFELLLDVTCVHFPRRPEPLGAFDVVYHLTSISRGVRMRFKVACPDPDVGVPSLVPVWEGAGFMEREADEYYGRK